MNPSLPVQAIERAVGDMCELLKHGGPDDGGIASFPGEHLVLGNRRLSLLDLSSAGHQPMHYRERYTITYNGELYNFISLKKELMAGGMVFHNHTDTEVILAAFAKWNTQSFSRLNGMFAFALWDNEAKMLYLVRDAAGIKPLYYSTSGNALCFASEIRAFAPAKQQFEKNEQVAVYQLAYGHIPEPVTTLKEVRPLPKGCFLQYDHTGKEYSLQLFSFFSFNEKINDAEESVRLTTASITDAVQRQMVADAPVGVFLSGGIDSGIVAGLADITPNKALHTLSIYFKEEKYSEKKYQDLLVKKLNSQHHSILLQEEDFHAQFPAFMQAMDMPSCDGINTWFISKFAAAEGLKAVLSGIGADELFGGYPSFKRMRAALSLQQLPSGALRYAARTRGRRTGRLGYLNINGMRGIYLFLRGHFTPEQIAAQLGGYEKDILQILDRMPYSQVLGDTGPGNSASWMEFNYYMQDQLLRDADTMSMAHGLEIRVPFLDNEVIRSAFSLSEEVKFDRAVQKELLVKSFSDILPPEIWQRKKMGFSFPFAEWLGNSPYVKALSGSSNKQTQKAYKDFMAGKLHWSRIMSLIVLNAA